MTGWITHLSHHASRDLVLSVAFGPRSGASKKSMMKSYRVEKLYPSCSSTQFGASDRAKISWFESVKVYSYNNKREETNLDHSICKSSRCDMVVHTKYIRNRSL